MYENKTMKTTALRKKREFEMSWNSSRKVKPQVQGVFKCEENYKPVSVSFSLWRRFEKWVEEGASAEKFFLHFL